MTTIVIVAFLAVLYFTYKPLFKYLKQTSFAPKAFVQKLQEDEVKKEFKDFSSLQLQKIENLIKKVLNSKDSNTQNTNAQDKTDESTKQEEQQKDKAQ